MTLLDQAMIPLKKYADFSGRASRGEFWTFFFFVMLLQAFARVLDSMFGRGGFMPGPIAGLAGLLLIVPQMAVAVRRLHDVNRSGRELIVPMVMLFAAPLVVMFGSFLGRIVALGYTGLLMLMFAQLVLMLIRKGSSIPNRYGAAPTAFTFGV